MNCVLTATANTNALLSEAGMTVLIGLTVVFTALLLLTCIFWLFGLVARKGGNTNEQTADAVPANVSAASVPIVEDGVPDEVVAVIAAAIAAMSDGQYAIRRIRPAHTNARPVWAAAGIAENTQSF